MFLIIMISHDRFLQAAAFKSQHTFSDIVARCVCNCYYYTEIRHKSNPVAQKQIAGFYSSAVFKANLRMAKFGVWVTTSI